MEGFYKYENGEWMYAQFSVHFPDGTILSVDNKIEKEGWVWMDSPPEGFEESNNLNKNDFELIEYSPIQNSEIFVNS